MSNGAQSLWERFKQRYIEYPTLGLAIDTSRVNYDDAFVASMQPRVDAAMAAMAELERGAIANPDENRMVGHYWLRAPELAPSPEIRRDIEQTIGAVKEFARAVHAGEIKGAAGAFRNVLLIGIGGSALGPQFVAHALGHPKTDRMKMFFFDNTDPDGMDKVLAQLEGELGRTLCVVVSKSGGTKETRNGMLEAEAAYRVVGLTFAEHAVAVTGTGSNLDKAASGWLKRFPMWDWVGGRTSETSAVGLLPAALQGLNIDELLAGAKACDAVTRGNNGENPAILLSLVAFATGNGRGEKAMVVLPYKDRLELFSKYLQQLVMESLGKEKDLSGRVVNQGLTVFGNKGSTDQHAYVQQLRDGLTNFFAVFIEVLRDRHNASIEVEPKTTSGDFLFGYYVGTRQALSENNRESVTLTVREVSPFTVGALIALFERFVGIYAQLIDVNAYHQPGVEAGKKAADAVITLQREVLQRLLLGSRTVEELASECKADPETVFKICEHLAANPHRGLTRLAGRTCFETTYKVS
jgi:glucose-6-phosphate isomerase